MDYRILMSVYKGDEIGPFRRAIGSIPDRSKLILIADGPLRPEVEGFLRQEGLQYRSNASNRGLAYSLNHALRYAMEIPEVHYFIRMDSDDITHPERFDRMVAFMEANREVDVCGTFYQEMDQNETILRTKRFPLTHAAMTKDLSMGSPICHASACFRRSFFEKAGAYSTETRHNLVEDIELWFRAVLNGAVFANIPEILYYVRISEGFYRRRSLRKSVNELRVYVAGVLQMGFPIWHLAFPAARFLLRISPQVVQKFAYGKNREPVTSATSLAAAGA